MLKHTFLGYLQPRLRTALIMAACGAGSCIVFVTTGACKQHGDSLARSALYFQDQDLPTGWHQLSESELPRSDVFEWWRKNPQVLQEREVNSFIVAPGQATKATQVTGVMYGRGVYGVALITLVYASRSDAEREAVLLRGRDPSDAAAVRQSRSNPKTVFVLRSDPDNPEKAFFVELLGRVAN
jgi:hypothetical protein